MAAKPSVTGMDSMWNAQAFLMLYADYRRELEEERHARDIRRAAKQAKAERRRRLLRRGCAEGNPAA
jgi:hypothetical protein